VRAAVLQGPGIDQTKELQRKHAQKALQELESFDENDARKALSNIIFAMGEI
jgi:decaprenyl-diphosphate synthase subunit 2